VDAGLDLEGTHGAGGCRCPLCSPKWRYKEHGFLTTRGSTIPTRKCRRRVWDLVDSYDVVLRRVIQTTIEISHDIETDHI
jgi:hypothetical protein